MKNTEGRNSCDTVSLSLRKFFKLKNCQVPGQQEETIFVTNKRMYGNGQNNFFFIPLFLAAGSGF
jgi:hypothetical protein